MPATGFRRKLNTPGGKSYYVKSKPGAPMKRRGARNLTQEVKKVMEGTQETKLVIGAPYNRQSNTDLESWTSFTQAITSTNEVYCLIPKLTQGPDDYQRIGNAIQPKKLTVKYNVCIQPSDLISAAVYADLWFCTCKTVKAERLTNEVPTGQFFNDGQGQNVPYDGTSFTAMLPVNKSEFNVISHKRIRLVKGSGDPNSFLTGSVTSGIATNIYYAKAGSVDIPVPAKYLYEEKTRESPTNAFPFLMVGFHSVDTTGGGTSLTARIQVQAQSHLYFKDA